MSERMVRFAACFETVFAAPDLGGIGSWHRQRKVPVLFGRSWHWQQAAGGKCR
ncbi:MAG: hypothetical protein ACLSD6_08975 [Clostridium sp.]